jgi:hypothetical protein
MAMKMTPIHVRVVVFKEGDSYIAQCLEYDICTQAKSPKELQKRFALNLFSNVAVCMELGKPLTDIPRAPQRYWKMFENAQFRVEALDPKAGVPNMPNASEVPRFIPDIRFGEPAHA